MSPSAACRTSTMPSCSLMCLQASSSAGRSQQRARLQHILDAARRCYYYLRATSIHCWAPSAWTRSNPLCLTLACSHYLLLPLTLTRIDAPTPTSLAALDGSLVELMDALLHEFAILVTKPQGLPPHTPAARCDIGGHSFLPLRPHQEGRGRMSM